uniref:Intraflagellar transport protein ift122 n=1 Tax=Tetraselmis sp. GSL018 TaxID=582737 RepID=A0A061S417_9CHLO|mmetsp:Transcript_41381/g.98110  ORF Transcript_41381/g.98110 Transcript_41381/m.98110 type:complete len:113 (+) Transcript_41381:86-424(+)|eukprot:CAMPEP_0177600678 /NCGR_PEP_ID=MMETSP0419_2-20121207/13799_1 /TAXON_ID=582737 /ORGANISM="Tetraselmis sp., Strain GSL018" /LENGTH=112 /DNA_ID=CAMNT_0019093783 /DNA_START=84 /DNA_END=422 /DNA_ORIENTATION=-
MIRSSAFSPSTPRSSLLLRRCKRDTRRVTNTRVFASISEGTRVRVKTSVKVYHVPKTKGAETELEGKEGVVAAVVSTYKGEPTSATLPVRVKFEEPVKFIAHLDEDELEILG